VTMGAVNPYAEAVDHGPVRFLHRLNPLSKLFAPLPAMVLVILTRDVGTPLAFILLAMVLLLIGAHLDGRLALMLFVALPLAVAFLSLSFGIWTDRERVPVSNDVFSLGDYAFTTEMWLAGLGTALRLGAVLVLGLVAGATSTGAELVRSLVQQLRVPYRIGYTALAAFRFVPRFGHELEVIRSAHRVRGMIGGRGPVAGARRYLGYVVPLLAGAIRHAERIALAMDARAFGAHPTRTERHIVRFRARDWVFMVLFWAVTAALFVLVPRLE